MFWHSKDVGSSPVAFKYFFFFIFFFDLLVSLSLFNRLNLFEFGIRLCNKYSTVNNFNKPTRD